MSQINNLGPSGESKKLPETEMKDGELQEMQLETDELESISGGVVDHHEEHHSSHHSC